VARILFTWELGGGLGHVTVLRPVAEALDRRGHEVILAVRDLVAARQVFHDTKCRCLQAPFKQGRPARPFQPPRTYAELLHNVGFAESRELAALVGGWLGLYDLVRPDLIVFDHSPSALLASRGSPARRALLGTGFCAPPASDPLPSIRPWLPDDFERRVRQDQRTLKVANEALQQHAQRSLERLCGLYAQVDLNLLTTFAELDHFGPRKGVRYWGPHSYCPGRTPYWPEVRGKRIFAYLKPSKGLRETIELLGSLGHPTIIHGSWVTSAAARRFAQPNLVFESRPLDLAAVAETCELAILNATHGATASFLLAGTPILQLPIYTEQFLTARRTVDLGAGLLANRKEPAEVERRLRQMLDSSRFGRQARAFAARYVGREAANEFRQMVEQLHELATARTPPPPSPGVPVSTGEPARPNLVGCF
jgi:UDP:flavonoid glycosyltransferase YjiC (YdhE family)